MLWTPPTQIYVEIERARLTRQLARMREAEGKVQEAAETLSGHLRQQHPDLLR